MTGMGRSTQSSSGMRESLTTPAAVLPAIHRELRQRAGRVRAA